MHKEDYGVELKRIRDAYFKVKAVKCPVLDDEYIYFDQQGFRHFLRKGKTIRPIEDQLRRFSLFKHAVPIITSDQSEISNIQIRRQMSFWALTKDIDSDLSIKVILVKVNFGRLHFLSIMDHKNKNSA
jgi:hypothetical protein